MSNGRIARGLRLGVVVSSVGALVASVSSAEAEPVGEPGVALSALREHLQALQVIADENGGTRASGTAGYDRSADYVALQLEQAGYAVLRQAFEFEFFQELSPPLLEQLTPSAVTYLPDDPCSKQLSLCLREPRSSALR